MTTQKYQLSLKSPEPTPVSDPGVISKVMDPILPFDDTVIFAFYVANTYIALVEAIFLITSKNLHLQVKSQTTSKTNHNENIVAHLT